MIYLFGALSTFIMVFGMEGRGTWSNGISIVGGLLWLIAIIWGFFHFSVLMGFGFLLGTFVLGAILKRIFKPLLNPHGH